MSRKEKHLLQVEDAVKTFGGFTALDGVSFCVEPNEILGLVGPNGSGKTTCINVITGLYKMNSGRVLLEGRDVSGLPAHKLVRLGIARTFQVPKPFMSMSVRENIDVVVAHVERSGEPLDVDALLATLELDRVAAKQACELNSVQQKMLDLARALASRPRLLCVDELGAGLTPRELDWMAEILRGFAASGMGMLVVEHLMSFIDQVTNRVIVMNAGKEIFEGVLKEALRDERVVEVYLGDAA